ncbi:mitotic-spindle organizing protein 1-like protein [Terfezia boudieri ATCC MYA-4762]|uniref:Mitotic-spindle organizing protein 1 n=1 Tax=Terfezia boudieri ATCC MYA-4762 TaxID=1051890 RepID=A0A3N4M3K3_9PEZI|nr:mitotic-spindle organizing protein 1-like protein [Terfezia boudieri ATCC MYA-4762]
MSERPSGKQQAAREAVDILLEVATLLLDRTTLPLCVHLIENGVNPEALASMIKELRRESEELKASTRAS